MVVEITRRGEKTEPRLRVGALLFLVGKETFSYVVIDRRR